MEPERPRRLKPFYKQEARGHEGGNHLNAEFQKIARRDKKAFFSDQRNRMGKTRDLFKKIRDTKGTFHAKMGSIKDRNDKGQKSQEEGSGWGTHVYLWRIHFDIWQN